MGTPVHRALVLALSLAWLMASATAGAGAPVPDACPRETTPSPDYDDHCGDPVQQDNDSSYPAYHLHTHDQGSTNTCYAYTAVEQIDAWRFSHGETNYAAQGSGLAAAAETATDGVLAASGAYARLAAARRNADGERTDSEVGTDEDVLETLRRSHRACDDRSVRVNSAGANGGQTANLGLEEQLRGLFNDYQAWERDYRRAYQVRVDALLSAPGGSLVGAQGLREQEYAELARERHRRALALSGCLTSQGFIGLSLPSPEIISELYLETNPLRFINGVLANACYNGPKPQITVPGFQYDSHFVANHPPLDTFHEIRDLLDHQRQPVQIMICDSIITDGPYTSHVDHVTGNLDQSCGGHSVLAIGKRRHCGKCQFLIRNTWGQGCSHYAGPYTTCTEPNRNGDVWINADRLSDNIYNYTYLH